MAEEQQVFWAYLPAVPNDLSDLLPTDLLPADLVEEVGVVGIVAAVVVVILILILLSLLLSKLSGGSFGLGIIFKPFILIFGVIGKIILAPFKLVFCGIGKILGSIGSLSLGFGPNLGTAFKFLMTLAIIVLILAVVVTIALKKTGNDNLPILELIPYNLTDLNGMIPEFDFNFPELFHE